MNFKISKSNLIFLVFIFIRLLSISKLKYIRIYTKRISCCVRQTIILQNQKKKLKQISFENLKITRKNGVLVAIVV